MAPFNFGPARVGERRVFGAAAPEPHDAEALRDWLDFLTAWGVERVVCLLGDDEIASYERTGVVGGGLLAEYRRAFDGPVLHLPIGGTGVPTAPRLIELVDFLYDADQQGSPTLVHCALGRSRTGIALAAWLVAGRASTPEDALAAVSAVPEVRRTPLECEELGLVRRGTVTGLLASLPPCGMAGGPSGRRPLLRAVS